MNTSTPLPLNHLSTNKVTRLFNATCAYCGLVFDKDHLMTKEHVIGRRFVPRGSLDGNWNLLLRACQSCNGAKAELEDDISALTMQPDALGRYSRNDPAFIAEARRRAEGAYSRKTRRKVKDSAEQVIITMPFLMPGATATFTLNAAPQSDRERVFRLAAAHIQGFFYFLTYEQDALIGLKRGGFVPGTFWPVIDAKREDWGNACLRSFAEITDAWHYRLHLITADGFFKAIVRRHLTGAEVWSWGLEWNESLRVVGLFGDPGEIERVIRAISQTEANVITDVSGNDIHFRQEVPLSKENDSLFTAPATSLML